MREIPIIALRRAVFFPGNIFPISVGRPKSLAAILAAEENATPIGLVAQRDQSTDDPRPEDLYSVGALGRILKVTKSAESGLNVVIQGTKRFRILRILPGEPHLRAEIEEIEDRDLDPVRTQALFVNLKKTAREFAHLLPEQPFASSQIIEGIDDASLFADILAGSIDFSVEEKMSLLENEELSERLSSLLGLLRQKLEVLKLSNKINTQVKGEIDKTQREYYLRQQLKAIRDELGESEETESDLDELERRLHEARLPPEVSKAAIRELARLRRMPSSSAEYSVGRTYLEWLGDLPWHESTPDVLDVRRVREVLDARHYGLEPVKKRIIEFLAVRKLKADMKGPILCLVGPPGVGKTSLAQSIAQALGRKMHRVSLGGVRDEAEIRGHRRTYVGALPGRIIQGLRKAGTNNPVFVLDEIDKLSADFHGDPSSALLEVLDPEQNSSFSDHYLEVPFDLSSTLFIATANQVDTIPPALKDRMEVLEISGYTLDEKRHIAVEHLIPKVLSSHGLRPELIEIEHDALDTIVTDYTREAGVRNLERAITGIVRAVAVEVAQGRTEKTTVKRADLSSYLGPEKFYNETAERLELPGVATGLAWTPSGGDILFVEATKMGGKGGLTLTGQLGGVMKESAQAALSYLRARSPELGVSDRFWEKHDLHIHVPAGAIPKDGPSAGVTLVAALASLITGIKVRSDVAMTGEITLRGHILPVGGIKEKALAALRAGIHEVILPLRNAKDLQEVPDELRKRLQFHFVAHVDEALDRALERPPERTKAPRVRDEIGGPPPPS